jgi:hypothetical protein
MKRPAPLLDAHGDVSTAPARPASGVRSRVTRTNLTAGAHPVVAGALVGRRSELDALHDLVDRERCVSVIGPAGVGKTRLARECAARFLDELMTAGGVWLIDVSRARGEADVVAAISRALGLDQGRDASLAERGATLLVLDDATDCASDVASLIDRTRREAPEIRWLVTSRVRLDAPREAILELGAMTLPLSRLDPRAADSVGLFVERARAASVGWSAEDPEAVAALVRALGGNALAIEVAAAWMPSLSLDDALAWVVDDGDPTSSLRSEAPRNQGLTAALAAAWQLASADEQRVLTTIAATGGGFDPEADALDGADARPIVDALVARGLVARRHDRRVEVARAVREGLGLPGADARAPHEALPADSLAVCARGRWFRLPHGHVVSISRWLALQNLLLCLADHREAAPDDPLRVEALIAAGWPGERILPKAGATRVYTALSTLRRLGLRGALLRRSGGYLLDPSLPIVRVRS